MKTGTATFDRADATTLMLARYHGDALRAAGRLAEARSPTERVYVEAKGHYGPTHLHISRFSHVLARAEAALVNHQRALELLL